MKKIRQVPIKKVWMEDNTLCVRIKARCGLYMIETDYGRLDFLASSYHNDSKNGRVFTFVGFNLKK